MAREDPHFRLRLPTELKTAIETAAKESGRSINAEIVSRLTGSFEPPNFSREDAYLKEIRFLVNSLKAQDAETLALKKELRTVLEIQRQILEERNKADSS